MDKEEALRFVEERLRHQTAGFAPEFALRREFRAESLPPERMRHRTRLCVPPSLRPLRSLRQIPSAVSCGKTPPPPHLTGTSGQRQ